MKTKKITFSSLMIAFGVVTGNMIYIPIGVSKCFPIQHVINVISAVVLGPAGTVSIAFCISLIRNILGTGSFLAFPGSMIGAFLSAYLYKKTHKNLCAVIGEIMGTGLIGGFFAYPVAKYIMGKDVAMFFFILPFSISTIGGSLIAYAMLKINEKVNILKTIKE